MKQIPRSRNSATLSGILESIGAPNSHENLSKLNSHISSLPGCLLCGAKEKTSIGCAEFEDIKQHYVYALCGKHPQTTETVMLAETEIVKSNIASIEKILLYDFLWPHVPEIIEKSNHVFGVSEHHLSARKQSFEMFSEARVLLIPKISKDFVPDIPRGYSSDPLSLPFPVSYFESAEGQDFGIKRSQTGEILRFNSFCIKEIGFNKYKVFTINSGYGPDGCSLLFVNESESNFFKSFMSWLLDSLFKEKVLYGSERVNVKSNITIDKTNYKHRIREIVYVRTQKQDKTYLSGKEIKWSHRWEVMGHWRKINGLGKNRNGEYSVRGYTWVKEHVRGPEHMPIIKKIRIIENQRLNDFRDQGAK